MQDRSTQGKTRLAILISSFLHEPFAALYPLLPFILCKDLGATGLQIVVLTALKPVVSLFSFYWSSRATGRVQSLRKNLLWAGILARLPFALSLLTGQVWILILASSIYMLFYRAGIPAWMEIIKRNLGKQKRQRAFTMGSALGYLEGVLIAIGVGALLDQDIGWWKMTFMVSILFGLAGTILQASIPIEDPSDRTYESSATAREPLWWYISKPWRDCIRILKNRPDFARFQWGFMTGGFGLMLIQPVIPIFFSHQLNLSYRGLLVAILVCKGFGFVLTSHLWGEAIDRVKINHLTIVVLLGFALFPACILFAQLTPIWIYVAYLIYGVAQAGSHLIWHLSGPLFSGQEESLRYSGVNLFLVGIRGAIAPPIGGILNALLGPLIVLPLGGLFCLSGGLYMFKTRHREFSMQTHAATND